MIFNNKRGMFPRSAFEFFWVYSSVTLNFMSHLISLTQRVILPMLNNSKLMPFQTTGKDVR